MPTVTVSSKHQITLPREIVRALDIERGSKLLIELIDDQIVLLPPPDNPVDYFMGSLKGVYGNSVEEIDQHFRELRGDWDRKQWEEQFEDLYAIDEDVRAVVDALRSAPQHTISDDELPPKVPRDVRIDYYSLEKGKRTSRLKEALPKLLAHGGVRKISWEDPIKGVEVTRYRLVRDFV